jgi:hypothetical protein
MASDIHRGFHVRHLLAAVLLVGPAPAAPAAVVVLANFTPAPVTATLSEPGGKPRPVTLAPGEVAPVRVGGPAEVRYPARPAEVRVGVAPYHAYVFVPDEQAGARLEGVELPGKPPARDARPEADPPPAEPVTIPVRLLVDDADPRAEKAWQEALKTRFGAAAAVVEAHSGVRLTFAGFGTWASDPAAKTLPDLLADFEAKVKVKPGGLAVGYTSRKLDPKEAGYGDCRGVPGRHVLVREWRPRSEVERVEVLVHHLGLALGAVPIPDPGSVMRPRLGDGRANFAAHRFRFDPLNALALGLWAEEFGRGPVGAVGDARPAARARLARVYGAILKANPGDSRALAYLNDLDEAAVAQAPPPPPKRDRPAADPKGLVPPKVADPGPPPAPPAPPAKKGRRLVEPKVPADEPPPAPPEPRRDVVAAAVVRAVVGRAKADAAGASGDDRTTAYVRAAARAALETEAPPDDRAAGFLVGLGVALDDGDALRADPSAAEAAGAAETPAGRGERLAVLGNPTVRGRRDLCRRFAAGLAAGGLAPDRAAAAAVSRTLAAGDRPGGVSFPGLAAELAGVRLAAAVRANPDPTLRELRDGFTPAGVVPDLGGLRDGLSAGRFAEDYGDPSDDRFREVIDDIRERLDKLPAILR